MWPQELAKLQDRVPPFDRKSPSTRLSASFRKPLDQIFVQFERTPVASASIAQVHFAHDA